jgi:hypothetical protein
MDRQMRTPIVLARIPDLRAVGPEAVDGERVLSRGRMINQALSFKLLAGAVVLLMVMAVVPYITKKSDSSADPPAVSDPLTTWQSASTALPTGPGPTPAVSVSAVVAFPPASESVVPIAGEQLQPAATGSRPASASTEARPKSPWPNPAHPTSASEASPENASAQVNQAMAIRPTEYLRNSHDCTRPSIH